MPSHPLPAAPRRSIATILALSAVVGCQSAVPRSLPGMFGGGDHARIAKLAKSDPFPSPADVGLNAPTDVP